MPVFVLSHQPQAPVVREGRTTFTFVAGAEAALDAAQSAAGGAGTAQQFLRAGMLDEIRIHLVPVLFGGGVRLFDRLAAPVALEQTGVIETPSVTHLTFRVVKP